MAKTSKRNRRLWHTYMFPGFRAEPIVRGKFGDPLVRIIRLKRRSKKRHAGPVAGGMVAGMTVNCARFVICHVVMFASILSWRYGEFIARAAAR